MFDGASYITRSHQANGTYLGAPKRPDRAQTQTRQRAAPRRAPARGRRVADDGEALAGGVELGERVAEPGGLGRVSAAPWEKGYSWNLIDVKLENLSGSDLSNIGIVQRMWWPLVMRDGK